MLTQSEENYLKVIYSLSGEEEAIVSTNAVAEAINSKAASATDMIQKLNKKGLVKYHKYQGVTPSAKGRKEALNVIRKHRLWEVFLVQQLKFKWDEVHEVAEQLEHVSSPMLIEQLDEFLGYPKYDPHGDPIPNALGEMESNPTVTLSMLQPEDKCKVICAKDSSSDFLLYLDNIKVSLGAKIKILDYFEYDGSVSVSIDGSSPISLSSKVAENIYIEQI
jgi:DtxR family transcriptional regulator, Mn-dependent transcriptional regulator